MVLAHWVNGLPSSRRLFNPRIGRQTILDPKNDNIRDRSSISVDPNHGPGASETYGDNFQFADANWHDTHAISATLLSTDFGNHALGTITAGIQTDATNGAAETVAWSYAVADGALSSLAPDQVVHEVFDFAIADNHGGVAHHQVAVNLSHCPLSA